MTSQSTLPAMNAELVRAGFQAFNSGDADRCLALAAPDLITNLAELPEPQQGRDTWRQGFEMIKHPGHGSRRQVRRLRLGSHLGVEALVEFRDHRLDGAGGSVRDAARRACFRARQRRRQW